MYSKMKILQIMCLSMPALHHVQTEERYRHHGGMARKPAGCNTQILYLLHTMTIMNRPAHHGLPPTRPEEEFLHV